MKKLGAVRFTGVFLEELKARLSLYDTIKNACWSDCLTNKNVFNHHGKDWLGERVVLQAAEDFSESLLMMLKDNETTRGMAKSLCNTWPPKITPASTCFLGALIIILSAI